MKKIEYNLDEIKINLMQIFNDIYNLSDNSIKENDQFKEHLAWDSMNGLMIMIEIKDKIYNDIVPEDILDSETILDLANKIFTKSQKK